jgi:hypothetical protein
LSYSQARREVLEVLAAVGVLLEQVCVCVSDEGQYFKEDWVRFYTYPFYYRLYLNSKNLFIHPCIPFH